jgi:lipopolysaccharide transport system ATP-binding protein
MDEVVISLKNISKAYKRYARPVDRLKELFLPGANCAEEFWALRDVNLQVLRGHTLGIVGRNGSGKSTLLQIIAGTLTQTAGEVQINGRISALLELGSGFNPEFTGRQNFFFNGQLLGLSPQEIEKKFDEIATFADIGSFIDQPVKTYSSGMFVRLAFAVAINVEPDILIVDEALSVGDEAFQRKCFSRIQAIQDRGGTILFVSHSASSVVELCDSAILIDQGELLLSGSPKLVISKYQKLLYAPAHKVEPIREEIRTLNQQATAYANQSIPVENQTSFNYELSRQINKEFFDPGLVPKSTISYVSQGANIQNPHITTLNGELVNVLFKRSRYIYAHQVKFTESAYRVRFGMMIKTVSGFELGGAVSHTLSEPIEFIEAGKVVQVKFEFSCLLTPGVYFLNAGVVGIVNGAESFLDRHLDVAMFRVQPEEDPKETGLIDFCVKSEATVIEESDTLEQKHLLMS